MRCSSFCIIIIIIDAYEIGYIEGCVWVDTDGEQKINMQTKTKANRNCGELNKHHLIKASLHRMHSPLRW